MTPMTKWKKDADKSIEIAKNQIADIEKNGWNAQSAFSRDFIRQLRDSGDLTNENLSFFKGVFERDLKDATLSKKTAQRAKEYISKSGNLLVDDIYDDLLEKADKNDKTKLRDNTLKVSSDMGVETKFDSKIKVKNPPSKKELAEFKSMFSSEKELNKQLDNLKTMYSASYGINLNKMAVNGKPFTSMSPEEQCYYLLLAISK